MQPMNLRIHSIRRHKTGLILAAAMAACSPAKNSHAPLVEVPVFTPKTSQAEDKSTEDKSQWGKKYCVKTQNREQIQKWSKAMDLPYGNSSIGLPIRGIFGEGDRILKWEETVDFNNPFLPPLVMAYKLQFKISKISKDSMELEIHVHTILDREKSTKRLEADPRYPPNYLDDLKPEQLDQKQMLSIVLPEPPQVKSDSLLREEFSDDYSSFHVFMALMETESFCFQKTARNSVQIEID